MEKIKPDLAGIKDHFKSHLQALRYLIDYTTEKIDTVDAIFAIIVNAYLSSKHSLEISTSFASQLPADYKLSIINAFAVSVNAPCLW